MINKLFELDWKVQAILLLDVIVIAWIFRGVITLWLKKRFSLNDMINFGEYVNKTIHFKKKVPELLQDFLNEKK